MLIIPDFNVNKRDGNGMTALMWAASNNQIITVEYLLYKQSADPHITTPNNESALLFASAQGHHEIVSLLLQNGVDINQTSKVCISLFIGPIHTCICVWVSGLLSG